MIQLQLETTARSKLDFKTILFLQLNLKFRYSSPRLLLVLKKYYKTDRRIFCFLSFLKPSKIRSNLVHTSGSRIHGFLSRKRGVWESTVSTTVIKSFCDSLQRPCIRWVFVPNETVSTNSVGFALKENNSFSLPFFFFSA